MVIISIRHASIGKNSINFLQDEFEDTKGVIRIRKSKKDRQHTRQKKKGQTTIYKQYTEN
jgi:hypothetical protein